MAACNYTYGSVNSKRAQPLWICRAFSNFSFPRVGHLLKQVSPGVGHCQSNVIFQILKVVHNTLFIIKFPDYPQYKNIKTELINVFGSIPHFQVNRNLPPPPHLHVPSFPGSSSSRPFRARVHMQTKRWWKGASTALWDKISNSVIKWGWKACTATTSRFRTLRVTYLDLSTNFASCISVVGLVWRIFK